jgi:hypothetical protein
MREYKRKKPLDADAEWMPTSLTKILKSPNIVGQVTVNGIAVSRAEPLVDFETWEHVKQILARNAARTGPKINQSPLLGVLFCMLCKAPMYIATASYTLASGETKKYRYYCCTAANRKRGCNARRVDAGEVERQVGDRVIASIGDRPLTEDEIIPAHDNSAAIAEAAEAIGELSSQKAVAAAMHLVGELAPRIDADRQHWAGTVLGVSYEHAPGLVGHLDAVTLRPPDSKNRRPAPHHDVGKRQRGPTLQGPRRLNGKPRAVTRPECEWWPAYFLGFRSC